jgi:uncharacterized protein YdhG (YjbR/CyaY superfamily)
MKAPVPETVDAYLAAVETPGAREALERLRSIIKQAVPDAEEVISYGMPGYKLNGYLVGFAAFKNHCSFFPGHTVADFAEELNGFKTSAGTIQFTPDHPIPEGLVRSILAARVALNLGKKRSKWSEEGTKQFARQSADFCSKGDESNGSLRTAAGSSATWILS